MRVAVSDLDLDLDLDLDQTWRTSWVHHVVTQRGGDGNRQP